MSCFRGVADEGAQEQGCKEYDCEHCPGADEGEIQRVDAEAVFPQSAQAERAEGKRGETSAERRAHLEDERQVMQYVFCRGVHAFIPIRYR